MIIYRARNKKNGKTYIGQTIQSLQRRITCHKSAARSGKNGYFNAAIRKHGLEQFEWKILCECSTLEDLQVAEKRFIAFYKSNDRVHGYNITDGGNNGLHSEQTKKFLSQQKKGRRLTGEWKRQIAIGLQEMVKRKYPLDEERVVTLYKKYLSTEAVAKELKTSRQRVRKVLSARNIPRTGVQKPKTEKQMLASSTSGKRTRTPQEKAKARQRMLGKQYGLGYKMTTEQIKKISEASKGRKHSDETKAKMRIAGLREDGRHANVKRIANIQSLIDDYRDGMIKVELEKKYGAHFKTLLKRIKDVSPDLPEQTRRQRMSSCKKRKGR